MTHKRWHTSSGSRAIPFRPAGDVGQRCCHDQGCSCSCPGQAGPFRGQTVPHSGNSGLLGSSPAKQLQNSRGCCEEQAKRLQLQGGRSPELLEELLSLSSPRLRSFGSDTDLRFPFHVVILGDMAPQAVVPTQVLPHGRHRQPENKYLGCQNQQCSNAGPQLPPPFCHSISDGVASPRSESSYFSGANVSNGGKSRLMVNTRQMCTDSASKLHLREHTPH